jgi:hypothetical protein
MMATGSSDRRGGNNGIIVHGDFNAGQVAAGEGARAVMNVASGASLRAGSRRGGVGQEDPRAAMRALLRELEAVLRTAPTPRAVEADLVASQATQLVKAANSPGTDRSVLHHIAKGLRDAAGFVKETVPDAVTIVGQIVGIVSKLHGLG